MLCVLIMNKNHGYCSVDGCGNKKNAETSKYLSFFSLPKEEERRNEWLKIIGRTDLTNRSDLKLTSHLVCSTHFERSVISHRQFLNPGAMPTKYLPMTSTRMPTHMPECPELETNTKDTSTQTSQINTISIETMKNASSKAVSVQSNDENINKNRESQSSISLSTNTRVKRRLSDKLKESEKKRRRLELELKKIEKEVQIKNAYRNRFDDDNDEITKGFHKLIEWQSKLNKNRRGNRCDPEYKLFALNLRVSSPQTYRTLKTLLKLPNERNLEKFKLHIPPKFEDQTLDYLTSKLKSLPDEAKYCILCVDEMVLKRHLYYDIRRDNVMGLHNINGESTKDIASNVCVLMLRGILVNWKQPVAYALLANAKHYENIETWINDVISKLSNIGIEVMAIVSDQGSNFDKLSKDIKNVTIEKPYFEINGRKIYYIFDLPHLIICLRNDLMANDFHYDSKKISWEYLRLLYSNEKIKDLRLIPKITEAHINPNHLQKVRAKYAAQIFSLSVVAALRTLIYTKDIPKEAKPTADFIEKINNLFDILNSNRIRSTNKYQTAFAFRKLQIEVLEDALKMFKKITATSVNENNKSNEPANNTNEMKTFKNIQISIKAILMLCKDLKKKGFNFVFTRRLNQDTLDNLFRAIRKQRGNCRDPTPIQFMRAFSKLFLCYLLKNPSHSHCQEDICDLLQKENGLFVQPVQDRSELSQVALGGEIDYRFDIPAANAITYVAGYLLFKCSKKHCCPDMTLNKNPDAAYTKMLPHFKAYNKTSPFYGELTVPPQSFINYIKELETLFLNNFEEAMTSGPGSSLFNVLQGVRFTHMCTCFPGDYLLKLFIRFRIFTTLKLNNRALRGGIKTVRHCVLQHL